MPTLDWIGKRAVENHHKEVPYRLLKCVPELSVGDPGSGNLLVQGDNLEALKALLPYYGGKVKCIYIDPPYNTGNENWAYNDAVNSPEMRQWLGDVVGRDDLSRHDKWLCMMYPRLALLREFLLEDGVIFVSLDDTEIGHARVLMDEIFGRSNILADCIWQKKYTRANDAKYFSDNHDHILAYAKAKDLFVIGRTERGDAQDKAYKNPDKHPLGPWKPTPLHAKSGTDTSGYTFSNGVYWTPPQGTYRRFVDETMARLDENNEIWFGAKGDAIPQRKTFLGSLSDGLTPVTIWTHEVAGDNHIGRDEVKSLLVGTGKEFDNPKPTTLIQLILQLASSPDALILDSFAGSGTTGHAVLKQNNQDGGKRRFILVEMDPAIAGDITAERLKRVALGYTNAKGEQVAGLGGGFRFCELGATLFGADGTIREEVKFSDLAHHVFFTETREPLPKESKGNSPLLGVARGTAVYLLYNGILKDKEPKGGNVLTMETLGWLPPHEGPKVVYGTACTLGERTLRRHGITFRQIPYEVRAS